MIFCERCNSYNIKAFIHVQMYIDANQDMYKLTKKAIAKKSTELWSADWGKTSFVCQDCGHMFGYGYSKKEE